MFCIDDIKILSIDSFSNNNAKLVYLEQGKDFDFNAKRFFFIVNDINNLSRGKHAHKLCSQLLLCIQGQVNVKCDDGEKKSNFLLNNPTKGLFIPQTIWAEQEYIIRNSILLVIADREFEEGDYIRDYNSFLQFRNI